MAQKDLLAGLRWTSGLADGAFPRGVVARGERTSTKVITNTEAGFHRIDAVPIYSGRSYMVMAHGLRVSVTGTFPDHYAFRCRYSTSGAATTSSTEIGRSELTVAATGALDNASALFGFVEPNADVTGSFIFTVIRSAGSGTSPTLQVDGGSIYFRVVDLGIAVPSSGTDL